MNITQVEKAEEAETWINKNHQQRSSVEDDRDQNSNSKIALNEHSSVTQIIACLIMASFHVCLGFALGFSAILVPQLEHQDSDIVATKTETSWIASTMVLMVPVGALVAGVLMEYVGRVNTIQVASVPCVLGWCLTSLSTNISMIIIGRVLIGISAGMASSPAIVYITEVANPRHRGMLISTGPGLSSLGILLSYIEGAFLSWRTTSWSALVYIILPMLFVRFYVPESPVWLVTKGRKEDARKALSRLGAMKENCNEQKLIEMVKSQELKHVVSKSFSERLYTALLQPTGYKPLIILTCLFFLQQFSGTYITLFYAVTFFEDVGSGIDPSIASIMVGCMRVVMSVCITVLMKRFCRRPLFLISCISMGALMALSGIFTYLINKGEKQYGWVPVVCILLYVCFSMLGLMALPWTMTAELFPTEIRSIAHGVVISVAHVFMFLALQLYRPLTTLLGGAHMVQWFFSVNCLAAALFIWVFLPETHNQKLVDIQQYFKDNNFYRSKKSKHTQKASNTEKSIEMQQIFVSNSHAVDKV